MGACLDKCSHSSDWHDKNGWLLQQVIPLSPKDWLVQEYRYWSFHTQTTLTSLWYCPTSTENNNITHFLVSSIWEIVIETTCFKTERPFERMWGNMGCKESGLRKNTIGWFSHKARTTIRESTQKQLPTTKSTCGWNHQSVATVFMTLSCGFSLSKRVTRQLIS